MFVSSAWVVRRRRTIRCGAWRLLLTGMWAPEGGESAVEAASRDERRGCFEAEGIKDRRFYVVGWCYWPFPRDGEAGRDVWSRALHWVGRRL